MKRASAVVVNSVAMLLAVFFVALVIPTVRAGNPDTTGDFIVTMSTWPVSGKVSYMTVKLTNAGAHTITWPGAVDWPGGVEPAWTAAGIDYAVFWTDDGGTIVNGIRSAQDVK